MPHRYLFVILGLGMLIIGASSGGWSLIIAWLGFDFMLLAVAYARNAPAIFGKKPDGALAPWSWVIFLPLHLYTLGVWHLYRLLSWEPAINQVTESLAIGRRLLPTEVDAAYDNHIDLTAEFSEPALLRRRLNYRLFPILDASVPEVSELDKLFAKLKTGKTFIHCAQGHGRTGVVAAAYLIFTEHAQTGTRAMELLQAVRPRLRLNRQQRTFLEDYQTKRTAAANTAPHPMPQASLHPSSPV